MPGTEAGKSGFYIDRFRRVSKWNVETVETENGVTLKWQEIQLWDDVLIELNWNLFLIPNELKCGIFSVYILFLFIYPFFVKTILDLCLYLLFMKIHIHEYEDHIQ